MRHFFSVLLLLGFAVLFVRVLELNFIKGEYFSSLAEGNRLREIPIQAPRGTIFDRNGAAIAQNETVVRFLRFEEGRAARFVDGEQASEDDVEVKGSRRVYPEDSFAAHLVGFLGEVNNSEVEIKGCPGGIYSLGELVGRMGVEASFDCKLRGKSGRELVEVDTKSRKVRVLGEVRAVKGEDLHLSIDLGLQRKAAQALGGQTGAVVALKPETGEILALVSSPGFDPNKISSDYQALAINSQKPLFNRAIGGAYPPGSTFKIVTAAAALEEGAIDDDFRFTDPGVINVGAFSYSNWYFTQYGKTEGELDIVRAIARSTDTFFYKIAENVGVEKIKVWADRFGLGQKTGIDIAGEVSGLVPDPSWKESERGERWFLGNTYHMSIGQGDITATPLQIATMTSVIASGGKSCPPHVLKEESQNLQCKDVGLSKKTIDLITQGMVGACSPGGTAFPLFNFKVKSLHEPESALTKEIQVACKTGTAEFGQVVDGEVKTHAWLTAFAPAYAQASAGEPTDEPEIVVTVLVEAGGEGSRVAAPIVKEVLEEWFRNK